MRKCLGCSSPISPKKRADAKYCSDTCRATAEKRRFRDRYGLSSRPPRGPYNKPRKVYESRLERTRKRSQKIYRPIKEHWSKVRQEARALGYRSGFERTLAAQMKRLGLRFE